MGATLQVAGYLISWRHAVGVLHRETKPGDWTVRVHLQTWWEDRARLWLVKRVPPLRRWLVKRTGPVHVSTDVKVGTRAELASGIGRPLAASLRQEVEALWDAVDYLQDQHKREHVRGQRREGQLEKRIISIESYGAEREEYRRTELRRTLYRQLSGIALFVIGVVVETVGSVS